MIRLRATEQLCEMLHLRERHIPETDLFVTDAGRFQDIRRHASHELYAQADEALESELEASVEACEETR